MKIQTILDQIDLRSMALPEFQRGYVWNRNQVKGLMDSLYRRHPVGSLLVWVTQTDNAPARGTEALAPGVVKLILDGQQRITSLYGIIKGKPPKFFDGNSSSFTGLYFHLDDEIFEFYAPMKMGDNPMWINVTELMKIGAGEAIKKIISITDLKGNITDYINRLNAIDSIKMIDLHIEEVVGEDKTVDVVVDIFNRVNSGGTKLSKGDLSLAKICAGWPEARDEMKKRLNKWKEAGFYFKLELFLRCITTITAGEAFFSALKNVDTPTFQKGIEQAEKSIDYLLNVISARLGLDHDRVLGSRYSFSLLVRYLAQKNWKLTDYREQDKLLFWYIHTFLWGRYAGSLESYLNQDLAAIEEIEGGLDRLIGLLRQSRGDLRLNEGDFKGWSRGARFYPLLYMMTRVCHTKDWESGIDLSAYMLGKTSSLQVHHIFPKALLYNHGYQKAEVNAIANFTFLTQDTNLKVSNKNPEDYLEKYAAMHPGAVESHWIPMDRNLWKVENYHEFLAARRVLLANAANDFIESLYAGNIPEMTAPMEDIAHRKVKLAAGGISSPEEEKLILDCAEWVENLNLPSGELSYELCDPETGEPLAVLDLAWPDGLQPGLSPPVALLIDESREVEDIVNKNGYLFFTSPYDLKHYVNREILGMVD
ncbi:MAG: DUF262 domain-containing protein [Desulfobacteraceae bacterium]|jgi:hypothetical protein|nr:MAG: DUF262 domain-containing protein [Desulfobacteraceae bacterium]